MHTPWGPSETTEKLTDGVFIVSTSSHGGLMISREEWAKLPANIRAEKTPVYGGFYCYEEDCAVGLVYEFRPDLVKIKLQKSLDGWKETLARPFPPEWAKKEGPGCVKRLETALNGSEDEMLKSYRESNRQYYPELFGLGFRCWICDQLGCAGHAHELVVGSATSGSSWGSPVPAGMVGVTACYGGRNKRGEWNGPEQYFLVPREEYGHGGRFFVVDPARHPVWPQTVKA